MLIVFENEEHQKNLRDELKDMKEKKLIASEHDYHSGITPPTTNVIKRKFSKKQFFKHNLFPREEVQAVEAQLREISLKAGETIEDVHEELVDFEDYMIDEGDAINGITVRQDDPLCFSHPEILQKRETPSTKITFSAGDATGVFGLSVLSGEANGVREYTNVGVDLPKQQVFIDRRNSSAERTDTDIRAGPLPPELVHAGELNLHMYVDHSIVTVIFENQTALTVHIPQLTKTVCCQPVHILSEID
jgi:hypothetical protein